MQTRGSLRLLLNESTEEPARKMTGPQELTYAKDYEWSCYAHDTPTLDQRLKMTTFTIAAMEADLQKLYIQQSTLRRMIAERRS